MFGFRKRAGLRLREVLTAIERGDLGPARTVFADAECEPWRAKVTRRIEARIERARADRDYGFLQAVLREDAALPQALRAAASIERWTLDQRPAGPDHREFLRRHGGPKSIDDIDD